MAYFQDYIDSPLGSISTIYSFEEIGESPIERFTEDGFEATMILKCPWNQRLGLARALRGGPNGRIYTMPARYPSFPSATCVNVDIEPLGQTKPSPVTGLNVWEFAQLTVSFKTKEWETLKEKRGEVLVSESIEGAAEYLTVPPDGLYWDIELKQKLSDAEAPGRLYKFTTWTYTLHSVPEVPDQLWDLVGYTNKYPVQSLTFSKTFAPETLLMNPPSIRREITVAEVRAWEVTMSLIHKPDGWNLFMRKGGKLPVPIYAEIEVPTSSTVRRDSTGQPISKTFKTQVGQYRPYEPKDFYPLLPRGK